MASFFEVKLRGGIVANLNAQQHKQEDGKIETMIELDFMTYQSENQNPRADMCSKMNNCTDLAFGRKLDCQEP